MAPLSRVHCTTGVFSLETGQAQGPDEGQVATYPARVIDGRIELEAAFLAARTAA